jgi:Fe-S oxidoreductase
MLQGEVIRDGWQSQEVYDALDLRLACKGCTSDCPVQVGMPTYKAEFLHHHFKSVRRWRPRYAYSFGLIDQASRIASRMPELVNFVTQAPGLGQAAKLAAGIAPAREIPRFAPLTLQQWWRERGGTSNPGGPRVVRDRRDGSRARAAATNGDGHSAGERRLLRTRRVVGL